MIHARFVNPSSARHRLIPILVGAVFLIAIPTSADAQDDKQPPRPPPPPAQKSEDVIYLRNADAEDVARAVVEFGKRRFSGSVECVPLPEIRAVRIRAPKDAMDLADSLVNQLDVKSKPARVVRVYGLEHVEAQEIAEVLNRTLGDSVKCEAYREGNKVVLMAMPDVFEDVEKLLLQLDTADGAKSQRITAFALEHVDPDELVDRLNGILGNERIEFGAWQPNRIVARGAESVVAQATELITQLDVPGESDKHQTRVSQLAHVAAEDACDLLDDTFGREEGFHCTHDPRTNTLIVTASEVTFLRVEQLLKALDVPQQDAGDQPDVRVFPLRHVAPDDTLEEALELVLDDRGSFAIDRARKQVLVKAPFTTQERVESILEHLDVPLGAGGSASPERRLRLVWLVSGLEREDAAPPPGDLKEVIEELAKIGVTDLKLAAQTVVTLAGSEFAITASPILDKPCELTIEGVRGESGDPNQLELRLKVREVFEYVTPAKPGKASSERIGLRDLCQLETTVSAPPGHAVVLGVTPIGKMTSVFVIQSMADN